MENFWSIIFISNNYVGLGKKHFEVHSRRITPVHFLLRNEKDAATENGNELNGVYFQPESAFSAFGTMLKKLFALIVIKLGI